MELGQRREQEHREREHRERGHGADDQDCQI